MKNFVITVARGFGSGGRQIAAELADELRVHSYENRILTLAARYSGYDEHQFLEADEKLRGGLLTAKLAELPKRLTPHANLSPFVSDAKLFEYQKAIIERLADTESCVIVGKCADYILRGRPNVVSVYIEAPRRYCLRRVVDRMDVTVEEANDIIAKTDQYRADYYRFYTHGNYWTNPVNYDLTLNSERLGEPNCVRLIIECLRAKMGDAWFAEYQESIGARGSGAETAGA